MRILVLSEYFHKYDTSTGKILSDLFENIKRESGFEIHVVTSDRRYRETLEHNVYPTQLSITRLRAIKMNRSSFIFRFLHDIFISCSIFFFCIFNFNVIRPNCVFVVSNPPILIFFALFLKLLFKTPVVFLIHDLYPDVLRVNDLISEKSLLYKSFHFFQKIALMRSSKIVVIGQCSKDLIQKRYDIPCEKIEVITNTSTLEGFQHLNRYEGYSFRVTKRKKKYVFYAGNLGKQQNIDILLDTARYLTPKKDFLLLIIGSGANREAIYSRIVNENLTNVRLLKPLSELSIAKITLNAVAAVVSIHQRVLGLGTPSKLYNLMYLGCPIIGIVPNTSETQKTLEQSNCGFVIDTLDCEKQGLFLSEIFLEALENPLKWEVFSENARTFYERNNSNSKIINNYINLFKIIVQGGENK